MFDLLNPINILIITLCCLFFNQVLAVYRIHKLQQQINKINRLNNIYLGGV